MKRKNIDWALVVGILMVIIGLIPSCYNVKKAARETNKALIKYPSVVAKIARDAFPCITLKSDTVITYTDTTIIVNCPTENDFENRDVVKHDTLKRHDTITHFQKVFFNLPLRTIFITKEKEDSAKLKIMQSIIFNDDEVIKKLQSLIDTDEQTINRKNKWILYLWLAVFISAVGIILKLILKYK